MWILPQRTRFNALRWRATHAATKSWRRLHYVCHFLRVPALSNSDVKRRAEAQYADLAEATREDRNKAEKATAENRVFIATVRAMQEECHSYKVSHPSCPNDQVHTNVHERNVMLAPGDSMGTLRMSSTASAQLRRFICVFQGMQMCTILEPCPRVPSSMLSGGDVFDRIYSRGLKPRWLAWRPRLRC